MYDSEGKSSADIAVSVTQTKKTVEVTYTPSAEWLNAEDRVYPVTIDPVTSPSNQESYNIMDTSHYYDNSDTEDMATSANLYMGQDHYNFIKIYEMEVD